VENEPARIAAFQLHQAAEHAYAALLLTFTLYLPATHDLVTLHKRAVELDPRLYAVWSDGRKPFVRGGRFGKRCFELLRDAYVKARYSRHYHILGGAGAPRGTGGGAAGHGRGGLP
jgi:uncharacterized protein